MDETEFTQGQYASFLVRLWRPAEPESGGSSGDWQGEVEHIQSGRCSVFASVSELCELLNKPFPEPWQSPGADTVADAFPDTQASTFPHIVRLQ